MNDCEEHIAFTLNASKPLGGNTTEYSAYENLKKAKDAGLLDPSFYQAFDKLEHKFQKWTHHFKPHPMMRLAWGAYWDIRLTKPFERPVTYIDIQAYCQMMRIDLLPEEVRLITGWDRVYYKNQNRK